MRADLKTVEQELISIMCSINSDFAVHSFETSAERYIDVSVDIYLK
jgi:hypothetical protein